MAAEELGPLATDVSEWALKVTRTSSLTAQGRVALQELQQAIPNWSGPVGSLELFAEVLTSSNRALHVVPALHVAPEGKPQPNVSSSPLGQARIYPRRGHLERHAAADRRQGTSCASGNLEVGRLITTVGS